MSTPTAVREALVAAIEDLTPATLPLETFVRYDGQKAFERMAADDIPGCFRKFALTLHPTPLAPPEHVNGRKARVRYRYDFAIAYPRGSYKSLATRKAIDQVRAEDFDAVWLELINPTTEIGATFVSLDADFPKDDDEANAPENEPVFVRAVLTYEMWRWD